MSYIYLASPYTHNDPHIMDQRYEIVAKATAVLFKRGFHVFSPIVHCHPIAKEHELPRDIDFWYSYSQAMLKNSSMLMILKIPGWRESRGIEEELIIAKENDIPVSYLKWPAN